MKGLAHNHRDVLLWSSEAGRHHRAYFHVFPTCKWQLGRWQQRASYQTCPIFPILLPHDQIFQPGTRARAHPGKLYWWWQVITASVPQLLMLSKEIGQYSKSVAKHIKMLRHKLIVKCVAGYFQRHRVHKTCDPLPTELCALSQAARNDAQTDGLCFSHQKHPKSFSPTPPRTS